MARWTEVAILATNEMKEIAGTGVWGSGMGGGEVLATQTEGGWLVEYKTSFGRTHKKCVLRPGRTYRVTRYCVRRVVPAEQEPDPVVRAVRMLGFSPALIVRHEPGEDGHAVRWDCEVIRRGEQVFNATVRWYGNFTLNFGEVRKDHTDEGTEQRAYYAAREVTLDWQDGMFAVEAGSGGNSAPRFHVCGTVGWDVIRGVAQKAFPTTPLP